MNGFLFILELVAAISLVGCGHPKLETELVYRADLSVAGDSADQAMKDVINIINRRVDAFGVKGATVERKGTDLVVVQLPKFEDIEAVIRLIGQTARLEFKERKCEANVVVSPNFYPCELPENHPQPDIETGLTGADLSRAYPGTHPQTGVPIVNLHFNSRGTRIFADLTNRLYQDRLANPNSPDRFVIFLDDVELIAPVVESPILSGSGFIEGQDFSPERVRTISIQLEFGRLPVPFKLVSKRSLT